MSTRSIAVNDQGRRIGEGHQFASLTDEQVERIRDLHEYHDLTYTQLAEMFGVGKSTIAGICQYRRRAQTPFGWKKLNVGDDES